MVQVPDEELKTKIAIESRIVARLQHILNAVELSENFERKQYVRDEVKAISRLITKGLFEIDN